MNLHVGVAFLTYQQGPRADGDFERRVARAAEQYGFPSVWFSEHHFSPDGYLPTSIPAMADVMAHTDRIGVGTGVALLPFHDVPRLDAGLRVLEKSGRPVLYGVGMGYRHEEFEGFGLKRSDRALLFEERLLDLSGRLSDRDSPVELWVGAIAEPAVERAARLGLPVLFPPGSSVEEVRRRIELYRSVEPAGARFGVVRDVVVGENRSAVEERIDHVVRPMYASYVDKTPVQVSGSRVLGADLGKRQRAQLLERFEANLITGDAASVREELGTLQAAGISLVVLRTIFPDGEPDVELRELEKLGEVVGEP